MHVLPHISFVWSDEDIVFLRERFKRLYSSRPFKDMEWSENQAELREWIPLIMNGRDSSQRVAATRINRGTDIDFGSLTISYLDNLKESGVLV